MLEARHRLVEPIPLRVAMLGDGRVHIVPDVGGLQECPLGAELPDIGLVAARDAQLEGLGRRQYVRELAEQQGRSEGRHELPFVLRQIQTIERRESYWWRVRGWGEEHRVCPVLVIALVRPEQEQAVSNERPSEGGAHLIAGILRLCERHAGGSHTW